jgi:hypothetical protein
LTSGSFSELRTKLDGNDTFVTGGHRVMKTAGATRHTARMKRVPVWANDDEQVRLLLLKIFPKLKINEKQRARAVRWMRVIYLYFRVGWTSGKIASELGLRDVIVRNIVRDIRRAANGKRSDTGAERSIRPRGRPKKNNATIGGTNGNQGDEGQISL